MLLRLDGVSKSFGGRSLFRDVSLTVRKRDRIGIVGPNGAGKTTLLRVIAGLEATDAGGVSKPRAAQLGLLRQEIDPRRSRSVWEELTTVFERLDALEREIRGLEAEMARCGEAGGEVPEEVADRYDHCRAAFEFAGGFEREARAERVLEGLGFDREARGRSLSTFSGGWIMRVELAKLLLASPDVLLLDEPTNHLDLPSIEWFEDVLGEYDGAVLIISHDRAFRRRHVERVAELESGRFAVYEGNYDSYLRQKSQRRALLQAEQANQARQIAQTERFIERFRYKASKARQVQSRVKALDRLERVEVVPEDRRSMRLRIPAPPRSGEEVLTLDGIHKRYRDREVYRGVDFRLRRGERVALAGPNGAGKSTLLRIAAGVLPFERGKRRLGHNVQVAFFAQHQLEVLDANRSVLDEALSVALTEDVPRLRSHLGAFLFSGDEVEKKVAVLSGGEKSRLALAKLLLRPSNLLVLDEPTNHLDLAACEVIESALKSYEGTLLFISHDRTFINALATRVVDVRAGVLTDFPGNYDRYLERLSRSPPAPDPAEDTARKADAPALSKRERMAAREHEKARARRLQRYRNRLAATEQEIVEREGHLETLSQRLGEPEVYRDGPAVRTIEQGRSNTRARIDALYREWERLVAEIEAAEGLRE
jgi:ATP-binding cassette subfamily F protein 3